jgi:hypothetical protein
MKRALAVVYKIRWRDEAKFRPKSELQAKGMYDLTGSGSVPLKVEQGIELLL